MIVWHDSVLKRRIRREAIAGFVLVYVKGRLMGELFRASAVALNMVEISLSEGFFFFFLNCTGKGLLMSQLCLGELYFMPLVLNMSVLFFLLDLTQLYTRVSYLQCLQCVLCFQRKSVSELKKKKKAGAIAI